MTWLSKVLEFARDSVESEKRLKHSEHVTNSRHSTLGHPKHTVGTVKNYTELPDQTLL